MKRLCGGDVLNARFCCDNEFQFEPTHKPLLMTNHRPQVCGTETAIWERIKVVPFTQEFTGERADPDLEDKLISELPAFCVGVLRGIGC